MLPILIISDISIIVPSQLLEDTYNNCSGAVIFVTALSNPNLFSSDDNAFTGSKPLSGINNIIIANIANGILLFVSLISSDTLILISIKINKNNIDTAPTYTSKYDIPINTIPIKIKNKDMFPNKLIKYRTDTTGFFAIIVNIADKKQIIAITSKNSAINPVNMSGLI